MHPFACRHSLCGNSTNGKSFQPVFLKISILIAVDMDSGQQKKEIIFVADTQAPIWVETLILKNRGNVKATELILENIIKKKPQCIFFLGDLVSLGYLTSAWKLIDNYVEKMKNDNIPVHAVLGNHELMARYRTGERNFQKRFPDHIRTGYCKIIDGMAVVLLNSNFSRLSLAEQKQQDEWYHQILQELESNPEVKAIIIGTHHPPYSNSLLVGFSREVQQRFVPPYIKCSKAVLFLTGHSHAFEYFKSEGKDFMIIGGGGGLAHPLSKKVGRFDDMANRYKPFFHYLCVKRNEDSLEINSQRLRDDFSGFESGYSLNIKLECN
jgi:predicted MPP superfamily phosphohydrolase